MKRRSEIPWICKDCGSQFETKAKLYEHRYAIHNIKRRNTSKVCPYCNEEFSGVKRAHFKICQCRNHSHTHTEETKQRLSIIRKEWLKNNPDKHPWKRKEKFKSVPCEHLKEILRNDFSFVEEYTDRRWKYNYSIDIAFLDKKVAIEINGNQHYNEDGNLKEYYQKRHEYLSSLGWIVNEIHYANCYKNDEIEKIKTAINESKLISNEEHLLLFQNKRKTLLERQKEKDEKRRLVSEMWNNKKEMILSSGIDLMKFGWVKKVAEKIGLTVREVEGTIKHFERDFEGKFFRRK
jgi:very-short-patch-repair endonuclease/ribosomal protein L37AE/L43A